MEFGFWFLVFICAYGYIGYPVVLAIITPFFSRYHHLPQSISAERSVSILVAAYNEEDYIATKIESLLNQAYPDSCFDIWILNDGSDDRTAEIVKSYKDDRVNLINLPRGGKGTALNIGMASSSNEIVVFSDADNEWTENTLMRLISPFSLPSVGAVSGQLSIRRNSKHLGIGDRLYRQYEGFIRKCETKLGSAVSADGGIFAIRRVLYQSLPQDVTDDFYISTGAILGGQSLVYQESAVAYDDGVDSAGNQLRRRIRVTVRGMTSLWRRRELFNIFNYEIYSFCLFSHKLVRRFVPFFAILLFPINLLALGSGGFYVALFFIQVCFYCTALAGLIDAGNRLPKLFSIAGFILLSSFGLAAGIVQFLLGKRFTFWSPEDNR